MKGAVDSRVGAGTLGLCLLPIARRIVPSKFLTAGLVDRTVNLPLPMLSIYCLCRLVPEPWAARLSMNGDTGGRMLPRMRLPDNGMVMTT